MHDVIPPTIDVHLTGDDLREAMERDVRTGLVGDPKSLPPVYFYDDRGSRLFDEITRLPEYYPTRSERSILGTSPGGPGPTPWSSSAPAPVRSHESCSTPCGPPGCCAGSSPST
jgi:hypothetical protein